MERWLPCCWWVVGEGPAVAKVAEALRVEVVVGCWGEVEVGASYSWVAAINLMTRWGKETLWTFWNTEYPSMTALHTSIFLNTDASLEFYRKLSQYKMEENIQLYTSILPWKSYVHYAELQVILTHGMSGGCWDLAHWRRGWLHPGWRHTIGIWRHMRATHVWHWWREVVRATMTLVHAMVIPVISMAWIHPRRTILKGVLWEIEILSFSFSNVSQTFKDALIY